MLCLCVLLWSDVGQVGGSVGLGWASSSVWGLAGWHVHVVDARIQEREWKLQDLLRLMLGTATQSLLPHHIG